MTGREQKSIERIKMASEMSLAHYKQPLIVTYSGGKDSDVMLELFKRSGVPFSVLHSLTTVDAPPTMRHIKEVFRDLELGGIKCEIDYHTQPDGRRTTMWNLIPRKLMPPTRIVRYCCSELKESGGRHRMIATGVRWAEGTNRRKSQEAFVALGKTKKDSVKVSDERMLLTDNDDTRRLMEQCQMKAKTVVNPLIDWTDREIWDFYWNECPTHNELYSRGYHRVGCVGCPMARRNGRLRDFSDFPTYQEAYIRAFDAMLIERERRGAQKDWKTGEEVFRWWMEDPNIEGQMTLDDFLQEDET